MVTSFPDHLGLAEVARSFPKSCPLFAMVLRHSCDPRKVKRGCKLHYFGCQYVENMRVRCGCMMCVCVCGNVNPFYALWASRALRGDRERARTCDARRDLLGRIRYRMISTWLCRVRGRVCHFVSVILAVIFCHYGSMPLWHGNCQYIRAAIRPDEKKCTFFLQKYTFF